MFGQLIIKPLEAQIAHNVNFIASMDCYVKFQIGNQTYRTRNATDQGKKPTWTDVITVNLNGEQTMNFSIWDHDTFTPDDFVCEGMVNLAEVAQRGSFTNYYGLFNQGKPYGQIMFYFQWNPAGGQQGGWGQQQGGYGQQQGGWGQQQGNWGGQQGGFNQQQPSHGGFMHNAMDGLKKWF